MSRQPPPFPTVKAALRRANAARLVGRDDIADAEVEELLNPERFGVRGWLERARSALARAWHRVTCRHPGCVELFGAFQHPNQNRRLARR